MTIKENLIKKMLEIDPKDSICAIQCMETCGWCIVLSEKHPLFNFLKSQAYLTFDEKKYKFNL